MEILWLTPLVLLRSLEHVEMVANGRDTEWTYLDEGRWRVTERVRRAREDWLASRHGRESEWSDEGF